MEFQNAQRRLKEAKKEKEVKRNDQLIIAHGICSILFKLKLLKASGIDSEYSHLCKYLWKKELCDSKLG